MLKRMTAAFIAAVIFVQALFILPAGAYTYDTVYDRKIKYITKLIDEDNETKDAVKTLGRAAVTISVSDGSCKAKIVSSSTARLSSALDMALEKAKKTGIYPKWFKVDIAVSKEEIKYSDFIKEYKGKSGGSMRSGISFNDYFGTTLIEPVINSNGLLNYETGKLSLKKVNAVLKENRKKQLEKIPSSFYLFRTQSYFCDGEKTYKLTNGKNNNVGRRDEPITKEYIEHLAKLSGNYLKGICGEDGKFIYGYYPIDNKEIEGYNIIRHAGTVWNLIMSYQMSKDEGLKETIENALGYLTQSVQYKDKKTAFLLSDGALNVGGAGLALLAYCLYAETFGSDKYNDIIEALANGIIYVQKEDGSFIHAISRYDYHTIKDYIIVYYDGEAMYGIIRAYEILHKKKYLDCAKKAADNFIANNYESLHSHWIAYGFNELTKFLHDEKYFEFGLKNINEDNYLGKIYNTKTGIHSHNETINITFELYKRLAEGRYKCDYLPELDAKLLMRDIEKRINYGLNYFMFPEYAMYFKEPANVLNSLAIREDNFRIRIDDIQHFMDGYYLYWKNFDSIAAYREKLVG